MPVFDKEEVLEIESAAHLKPDLFQTSAAGGVPARWRAGAVVLVYRPVSVSLPKVMQLL